MKAKLAILLTGSFLLMVLLGMYFVPQSPPAKDVDLKIVKVEGVWKVALEKESKDKIQTSDDMKIDQYTMVTGKSFN